VALEIIWTKEAKVKLAEVIATLEEHGNNQLLKRFSQQLEKKLELIRNHPQIYQKSDRLKGTRRCVIDKYHSLLYSNDSIFVYILTLWDNRQNPE
jgi:plasmid stabilization system protein ParE